MSVANICHVTAQEFGRVVTEGQSRNLNGGTDGNHENPVPVEIRAMNLTDTKPERYHNANSLRLLTCFSIHHPLIILTFDRADNVVK